MRSPFLFLQSFEPKLSLLLSTFLAILAEAIHSSLDVASAVASVAKGVYQSLTWRNEPEHSGKLWLTLAKRPQHITFVLNEEPHEKDLAKVIKWCLSGGVRSLCLYGKVDEESIKNSVQDDRVSWGKKMQENELQVFLLPRNQGRTSFVAAARDISSRVRTNAISVNDINEATVAQADPVARIPDPELMVLVGKVNSYMNCLPWHIRLTEMHYLDTLTNVSFDRFYSLIKDYSKCEQRFGK